MKYRFIGLFFLVVSLWVLFNREKAAHHQKVHYQAEAVSEYDKRTEIGYTLGNWQQRPHIPLTFFESLSYKKISNYVFVHYNIYKIELIFTDLGYTSQLDIKVWSQEAEIHIAQPLGFKLPADRIDGLNFHIQKYNFQLVARQFVDEQVNQTTTVFNLTLKQNQTKIDANLTHYLQHNSCFNLVRPQHVFTHKCYGGHGQGRVSMETLDANNNRKYNVWHLTRNLTRTALDVLRGPGMHWKFVWAMGTGFDKQEFYDQSHKIQIEKFIGLNFGHLSGVGEDFVFWNDKIFPVKGLKYEIDENKFAPDYEMVFRAEQPPLEMTFKVQNTHHDFKDMMVARLDLTRAQGFWTGWIEIQGKRINITHSFSGVVEVSDSLF